MTVQLFNRPGAPGSPFYREDFSVLEVVAQYDAFFKLGLTEAERNDLVQDLFGPVDTGSRAALKPRKGAADGWSR